MPTPEGVVVVASLSGMLAEVVGLAPLFAAILATLAIGWGVAEVSARAIDRLLEPLGARGTIARGPVGRAPDATGYALWPLVGRIGVYTLLLSGLQVAFGIFGPNPMSFVAIVAGSTIVARLDDGRLARRGRQARARLAT